MSTKGTTQHSIRIPDALWRAALTIARERGDNLSDIIRQALNDYINEHQGENNAND